MKTILLIGSSGFIGKRLKIKLKGKYHLICPSSKKGFDIANLKKLNSVLKKKIDIIINLSGQISSKAKLLRIILKGNKNIVKALKFKNRKVMVYYISSSLVYGYSSTPLNEKSLTRPITSYSKIKLQGEKIYSKSNLNFKILRLSNVYSYNNKDFINNIIYSVKKSKKLIVNNINSFRNYIFIEDAVNTIIKILKTSLKYKVYNIGHENLSLKKIINMTERSYKKKLNYVDKKISLNLDSSQKVDYTRLLKEIKYKPKVKFIKFLKNEPKFH